jgi:hypothetical protein
MHMKKKIKQRSVSVYANGKPRMWRRGNWTLRCWGFDHAAADIECFVKADDVPACGNAFLLRCESAEQCEAFGHWLLAAAAFARKQAKQRTVGQRR